MAQPVIGRFLQKLYAAQNHYEAIFELPIASPFIDSPVGAKMLLDVRLQRSMLTVETEPKMAPPSQLSDVLSAPGTLIALPDSTVS